MSERQWPGWAKRFRKMAGDCRKLATAWPDPDIAVSLKNAASELETAATAMLERTRRRD